MTRTNHARQEIVRLETFSLGWSSLGGLFLLVCEIISYVLLTFLRKYSISDVSFRRQSRQRK